jgi:hypothetical protein
MSDTRYNPDPSSPHDPVPNSPELGQVAFPAYTQPLAGEDVGDITGLGGCTSTTSLPFALVCRERFALPFPSPPFEALHMLTEPSSYTSATHSFYSLSTLTLAIPLSSNPLPAHVASTPFFPVNSPERALLPLLASILPLALLTLRS